jgi:hypothetical protein
MHRRTIKYGESCSTALKEPGYDMTDEIMEIGGRVVIDF